MHPRFKTPHRAEIVVGVVVATLARVRGSAWRDRLSSFAVLLYYAIANASAWTLGHRLIPAVGLVGCLVLAFTLPLSSVITGLVVVAVGAAAYGLRSADSRT